MLNKNKIKEFLEKNSIKYIYHFTSVANVDSINKEGALLSYKECIKRGISPVCGGSEISRLIDMKQGLDDYVRFSFCIDHPMRYHVRNNTGQPTLLLKFDSKVLLLPGVLVSDINAVDGSAKIYPASEGLNYIHVDAVNRRYVRSDDEDFKFHQAEILVPNYVSLYYFEGVVDKD